MAGPVQPKLRLRDKRRRLMWIKVLAGTAVVLVTFAGFLYVTRLEQFQITEVVVSGSALTSSETIAQSIKATLSGSYFIFIPKSNALLFPARSIETELLRSYPEIASVHISRVGMQKVSVTVKERTPVAVWCGVRCFLMDSQGFLFSASAGLGLIQYGGAKIGLGETYLDGGFPSLHEEILAIQKKTGRPIKSVSIDDNGDVHVTEQDGGVIKFVLADKRDAVVQNIASVFASQRFKSGAKFEYADFRYGDRIVVKFLGE